MDPIKRAKLIRMFADLSFEELAEAAKDLAKMIEYRFKKEKELNQFREAIRSLQL